MGQSATLADVVRAVAEALRAARDELNRLDGVAGDGDLGLTAGRAADALDELAPTLAGGDPAESAKAIGMAVARRAPSTGGTLIAFAFLAAGRVALGPGAAAAVALADLLDAARDEIAKRGKVGPGDRTILDAVGPAVDAYRAAIESGSPIGAGLTAAAAAAEQGAAATAGMAATVGRAGWLADRAAGHEDAGARVAAIVFRAAAHRATIDRDA